MDLTPITAQSNSNFKLLITEPFESAEFKNNICLPYFTDIYKDLQERSDSKSKGINKISFISYCQLPGLIAERLFTILDTDKN